MKKNTTFESIVNMVECAHDPKECTDQQGTPGKFANSEFNRKAEGVSAAGNTLDVLTKATGKDIPGIGGANVGLGILKATTAETREGTAVGVLSTSAQAAATSVVPPLAYALYALNQSGVIDSLEDSATKHLYHQNALRKNELFNDIAERASEVGIDKAFAERLSGYEQRDNYLRTHSPDDYITEVEFLERDRQELFELYRVLTPAIQPSVRVNLSKETERKGDVLNSLRDEQVKDSAGLKTEHIELTEEYSRFYPEESADREFATSAVNANWEIRNAVNELTNRVKVKSAESDYKSGVAYDTDISTAEAIKTRAAASE